MQWLTMKAGAAVYNNCLESSDLVYRVLGVKKRYLFKFMSVTLSTRELSDLFRLHSFLLLYRAVRGLIAVSISDPPSGDKIVDAQNPNFNCLGKYYVLVKEKRVNGVMRQI